MSLDFSKAKYVGEYKEDNDTAEAPAFDFSQAKYVGEYKEAEAQRLPVRTPQYDEYGTDITPELKAKQQEERGVDIAKGVGPMRADAYRSNYASIANLPAESQRKIAETNSALAPVAQRVMSDDPLSGKVALTPEAVSAKAAFRAKNGPADARQPELTLGDAYSDAFWQAAVGANNIVGSPFSAVAPDGNVAQYFKRSADMLRNNYSPALQHKEHAAKRKIDAAREAGGEWGGFVSSLKEYGTDPALSGMIVYETLPSMLGVIGPMRAAQVYSAARGLSPAASASLASTTGGISNAIMNGGAARQEAYDTLLDVYTKSGMTAEEANDAALKDSLLTLTVGAGMGFLGGKFGGEAAVMGLGGAGQTIGKGGAMAAAKAGASASAREVASEQGEEVLPQVVTNSMASERDGRNPLDGIGEIAAKTLIGTGPLAGVGAASEAGRAYDPTGVALQDFADAVEGTDYVPMPAEMGQDTAETSAARESALAAWNAGIGARRAPAAKTPEQVLADIINDAPAESTAAAPPLPVEADAPAVPMDEAKAGQLDQQALLGQIERQVFGESGEQDGRQDQVSGDSRGDDATGGGAAVDGLPAAPLAREGAAGADTAIDAAGAAMGVPGQPGAALTQPAITVTPRKDGTAVVTGEGAQEAVANIVPKASMVRRADGSVLVGATYAPAVQQALQSMQTTGQPTETAVLQQAPTALNIPQEISARIAKRTDAELAVMEKSNKDPAIRLAAQQEQKRRAAPIMQRDDLVGAIMRITGGRGINPDMALTLTGDTANRQPRLRGLFKKGGTSDMSDLAELLRVEQGYDVRDGTHLEELIREQAAGNPVYSMERNERDAAESAERQYRDEINKRAVELGLKQARGKRTLAMVEADIARVEQERNAMEAREERAAIQAESAASTSFITEDAPMTEDDFRRYFEQAASIEYTQEDFDRAEEYRTNRANARAEAEAIIAAEEQAQSRAGERNQDGETQEGARGTAERARPGLTLVGETNEEAAANFARRQQGEPEITREQADRERDAVPFSLDAQSQPKPQGVQNGLFTADGRPAAAVARGDKGASKKPEKSNTSGERADGGDKPVSVQAGQQRLLEMAKRLVSKSPVKTGDPIADETGTQFVEHTRVFEGRLFPKDYNLWREVMGVGETFFFQPSEREVWSIIKVGKSVVDGRKFRATHTLWQAPVTPASPAAQGASTDATTVYTYTPASKVESTAQGALLTAREHKKRAYEQVKRLRQQIKDEPINGNRSGLRLDLMKAEDRHREYQRMEESALDAIEAEANKQGLTTRRTKGNDGLRFSKTSIDYDGTFIEAPNGSLEFGEITNDIGKNIRRQAGSIRLREGSSAEGRRHIMERHGNDILRLGYAGVAEFVFDVASNFDAIYQGDGTTLVIAKLDKPFGKMNVVLELQKNSSGDVEFYDVKNATPIRADQFKNKTPIWTKEKPLADTVGPNGSSADADPLVPRGSSGDSNIRPDGSVRKSFAGQQSQTTDARAQHSTKAPTLTESDLLPQMAKAMGSETLAKVLLDSGLVTGVRGEDALKRLAARNAGAKFMVAWHGTPHSFDQFSLDRIGTGEGAQAYGYGLYFAGRKDVAEWYRNKLSIEEEFVDGQPLDTDNPMHLLAKILAQESQNAESARDALEVMALPGGAKNVRASATEALRLLDNGSRPAIEAVKPDGHLYRVDLKPAEDEYLLWDRPLSKQSEKVKAALASIGIEEGGARLSAGDGVVYDFDVVEGSAIYGYVEKLKGGDKAASDHLRSIGIRGIKYMDGSSRNRPLKDIKAEFLAELPEDADTDEVMELVGTGIFSPKNEALIKALADDDWLGFDYPARAISAALGSWLSNYDASPALLQAVSDAKDGGTHNYVIFDDADISITDRYSKQGEIQGVTLPDGRIILNLDALTADNFAGVFKHEGFHSTIHELLGDEAYQKLMDQLVKNFELAHGNDWVAKAWLAIPSDTKAKHVPEEIAAYAIEQVSNGAKVPGFIQRWVREFLSAVRVAVIRFAKTDSKLQAWAMNNLKPEDLARLAVAGLRAKALGAMQGQPQMRDAVAFSKKSAPDAITIDGANTDIRYSRAQPTLPGSAQQQPGRKPDLPADTLARKQQRMWQDKLNRFTVIKEWLADNNVTLSEQGDVYKAEERMHSRFANKAQDFREKRVMPLVQKVQKAGFTMEDVSQFLHANHAQARNAQIAKVNKRMPDGGSGMTNADAQAILAAAPAELKALALEFRAITEDTTQILLSSGVIDQDAVNAWKNAYGDTYVPLKGGPDENAAKTGTGKGLSLKHKQKRALGHDTRAEGEWIIENILADHERALMAAEKNRVFHSLVKMALETAHLDLVTINKPEKRQVLMNQAHYVVRKKGAAAASFRSEAEARAFIQYDAAVTKASRGDYVIEKSNDPSVALMASPVPAPDEATGYINGQLVRLQFNDPLMAEAYNNMGTEAMNVAFRAGRALNTYFSKAYTGYSPEFLLTNVIRDFTTGLANVTGEEGIAMAGKAAKNYAARFFELAKYAATGNETKWVKMYREDGGNTGAAYLSDLERLGTDVQTEFAVYQGVMKNVADGNYMTAARAAGRKTLGKLLYVLEVANMAGENAMRLAVYQSMIESGKSRAEAASMAKNVTVNFNRKGTLGQHANAAYLFFNAGVQGTAALAHAHFKGKHKFQAWGVSGTLVGLGYMLSLLAAGDDENEYEKLNEFERERNVIIKTKDGFQKTPIPYGYGFFWNLGRAMADAQRTGEVGKMPWQLAASFVSEFTPFGAVVAGKEADGKQAFLYSMPTVAQIVGAPLMNKTSFGSPLMPESGFDRNQPDRDKMNRGTRGTLADDLAGALEAAGMDVSPETLKFLWRTGTGGAGTAVTSTIDAVKLKAQGADLDIKEIPFVRKLYTETDVRGARARYYEAKDEADKALSAFKRAQKKGDDSLADKIEKENQDLIDMAYMARAMTAEIKAARDRIDSVRLSGEYTKAEERMIIKQMEKEESEIYDDFIAQFKEAKKKMREHAAQREAVAR